MNGNRNWPRPGRSFSATFALVGAARAKAIASMTPIAAVASIVSLAASIVLLALLVPTAHAEESLFGYLYLTDTQPAGHWGYEQIQTVRGGKARGGYLALDLRNEIEYAFTDRFQVSTYINSSYLRSRNVYDAEDSTQNIPDQGEFTVNGMSVEMRYRVLSPYTDPIGLAVYMEPEVSLRDPQTGGARAERAIEFRLILQKNFRDDTLVFASNLMLEPEWEIAGNDHMRELWAEITFAASQRIGSSGWWVGLEFRNHREFPNMDFGQQEHSAFFLGPSIHYGSLSWWFTFTVLPQITGHPKSLGIGADGNEITDSRRHLGQHEKIESRFKFGFNF